MTYSDPWCAAFVSAVGMALGMSDIILPSVNCDGMIDAYRAKGEWVEDDAYNPTPADLIFYDWQDSGVGDNQGSSDHVGIVVAVNGQLIDVIEGNYSDAVKRRYIYQGDTFIRGFAVPGYAAACRAEDTTVPTTDPVEDATQESEEITAKPDGSALCAALPVLSYGCCGRAVVVAQGILIALGYSCGPDGADGDFGYNTRNAVKRFQRGAGLPETGKVDAETWAKLLGV
ncbi:MAG: peptidoglycan-binding protein [Oscillospiraceae bacterium]|nr:peptidoglycan-binding protein [Oscillospiraceae bacterium]